MAGAGGERGRGEGRGDAQQPMERWAEPERLTASPSQSPVGAPPAVLAIGLRAASPGLISQSTPPRWRMPLSLTTCHTSLPSSLPPHPGATPILHSGLFLSSLCSSCSALSSRRFARCPPRRPLSCAWPPSHPRSLFAPSPLPSRLSAQRMRPLPSALTGRHRTPFPLLPPLPAATRPTADVLPPLCRSQSGGEGERVHLRQRVTGPRP